MHDAARHAADVPVWPSSHQTTGTEIDVPSSAQRAARPSSRIRSGMKGNEPQVEISIGRVDADQSPFELP
jgi:hypothetical protein